MDYPSFINHWSGRVQLWRVILLSGDEHCSALTTISSESTREYCVASGLSLAQHCADSAQHQRESVYAPYVSTGVGLS